MCSCEEAARQKAAAAKGEGEIHVPVTLDLVLPPQEAHRSQAHYTSAENHRTVAFLVHAG
jgi:hypothetical protein